MIFQADGNEYSGATAIEVVRLLEHDAPDYPYQGGSIRQFLLWSLRRFADHIPMRELDLGARLSDEAVALNYLYLRHEYNLGELKDFPSRRKRAG